MKLEAERMRNLKLTQKTIDSERQVVEEELRVRLENNPVGKALREALALTYTTHPYASTAAGNKKDLDTVDARRLPEVLRRVLPAEQRDARRRRRHRRGDGARRWSTKYFGPLEKGPSRRVTTRRRSPSRPRARARRSSMPGAAAGDRSAPITSRRATAPTCIALEVLQQHPRRRRVVAAAPAPRAQGQDGGGGAAASCSRTKIRGCS